MKHAYLPTRRFLIVGVLTFLAISVVLLSLGPVSSLAFNAIQFAPTNDSPIVESEHPYANNADLSWTVEMAGAEATRIHFSRIELEDADLIIISDPADVRTQVITGSYLNGMWSDPVPGEFVKIRLITDSTVRKWGFAIDQKDAVGYQSLARSAHPYLNGTSSTLTLYGTAPGEAVRVHFSKIDLEENVDWIILKDLQGNPFQYFTGEHPTGLWSIGVPGAGVIIEMITDDNVERWGFNVDQVGATSAGTPLPFPTYSTVVESDHPYAENSDQTWTIVNPDPASMSTKVHFTRIDLRENDYVELYDVGDRLIQRFWPDQHFQDLWSDYVPGRVVKVRLRTASFWTDWGFRIDRVASGESKTIWAESPHPFAENSNELWTFINPDSSALSTKIHFSRIDLRENDNLYLYDANDVLVQYWGPDTHTSGWSDYIPGRVAKLRLVTAWPWTDWGFRVDNIANGEIKTIWAQSNHPYDENSDKYWTIINPNPNASQTKVHFSRIDLRENDFVEIQDSSNTTVQRWQHDTHATDVWSDWVSGRIVKVHLHTAWPWTDWGFRIDDLFPLTDDPITPAAINGVYIQVNHPGTLYLNNVAIMNIEEPGDYKVLLSRLGEHRIRIEYMGYTQEIEINVTEQAASIIYLPLIERQ